LLEKSYRLFRQVLGEKHPKTLISLNNFLLSIDNVAGTYLELGRHEEGLLWFEKGYSLAKEVFGEKHPETLIAIINLGAFYKKLGRLNDALSFLTKSYSILKEVRGEKHPLTINNLNKLVEVNLELERLNDALRLAEKSLAGIYQKLDRLDDALPLAEKGYRLIKAVRVLDDKHPITLTNLNILALIHKKLGHLNKALAWFEQVYHSRLEVLGEKHSKTLESLSHLASIYKDLGRLTDALALAEKGYRLAQKVFGEKHVDTLKILNNLALIYQKLGSLKEALPLSEKGYRFRKEVLGEKHPNTLTSLNNLALIYQDFGRLNEALPLLEKGYRLSTEVLGEKHLDTLARMNNLASIYESIGRLDKALPWFQNSYRLFREVLGEKHPNTLTSLGNLAFIYGSIGRLDEALSWHEKAYRLSQEVLGDKHLGTLTHLNNLADTYRKLGKLDKALPLAEKSYRLFVEVLGEKNPNTLTSLSNLAAIYQELDYLDKALPLLEKAYRLSVEVLGEKNPATLSSLNNLTGIYPRLGRLDEALSLSEKAYQLSKEVLGEQHPQTIAHVGNLASLYLLGLQKNFPTGFKHFEQFVAGVESLRQRGDLSAENRQALFTKWVKGYFTLSLVSIRHSRPVEAFRLAEMSKARTLLESLAAKLAAQQSGLTAKEQQQLQDDEARLAFLNDRIGKALKDNRLEEHMVLETEKTQLLNQFNQFHRELMAKYPKYAQLSEVQIISAQEGAKYLPADAVLISYQVDNNWVLAFTLQSNGKLTAHDLGKIPNLKENVEDYQRQLSLLGRGRPIVRGNKIKKDRETLSRELGKQLLGPLSALIKDKSHWIISPDGPLALIPFETLRLEGEKQPVIAQHQISYVQSLSVLKLLQERDKAYKTLKERGTLLAMGAPLYEQKIFPNSPLLKGRTSPLEKEGNFPLEKGETSPLPKHQTPTAAETVNPSTVDFNIARRLVRGSYDPQRYGRAFRQLGLRWRNLPGALAELEQLEALFKETQPAIYKQEKATEAQLQTLNQQGELANYRYLVFSAHGYLSPQVSALSSIVLGQINNPPGIDGYVTAGEWPSYDLKSDLMVLSACETGRGEVVGGEGVMGLPYAFYVAGNKNTLLTLWSISDKVTTKFVTRFFEKLKDGMGQLEALTATKREFIKKGGRTSLPAYWAAFVLYGV